MTAPRTDPDFVFVMAYGRSGSTLVQAVLNALPGTCIRGENGGALRGLCESWRRIHATPQLAGAREAGVSSDPATPWFGAEATDPDGFARALGRAFTDHVLAPPPGARLAGCKEIRFHEGPGGWNDVVEFDEPGGFRDTLDFLMRAFPGARFVFNTRAPGAVARSGWWRNVQEARVRDLVSRVDALFDAAVADFPDRALRLRYNDYARDPAALAPLFAHLGRPFEEDLAARVLSRRLDHTGV